MNWVRTRIAGPLIQEPTGKIIYFLIGQRDDGGVFWQSFTPEPPNEIGLEISSENARLSIDRFLYEPLNPNSIGNFDVEPTFYIPEWGPQRL